MKQHNDTCCPDVLFYGAYDVGMAFACMVPR